MSVLTDELKQSYGLLEDIAANVIGQANTLLVLVNQPTRPRGLSKIKTGGFWLVLGLVFTYVSYIGALDQAGTGRYFVATGAIVWGAYTLLRGLGEFTSVRK